MKNLLQPAGAASAKRLSFPRRADGALRVIRAAVLLCALCFFPSCDRQSPVIDFASPQLTVILDKGKTAAFFMGSSADEIARQPSFAHPDYYTDDETLHEVLLTVPYAMGIHEITVAQACGVFNWAIDKGYAAVSGLAITEPKTKRIYVSCDSSTNDRYARQPDIDIEGRYVRPRENRDIFPVCAVSWYGAVAFCNFLSESEGLEPVYDLDSLAQDRSKNGYRLPTEAEWEYAARGTGRTAYAYGEDFDRDRGNSSGSLRLYGGNTMPVGFYDGTIKRGVQFKDGRSPTGLYDMTGNVWEWCWDWYGRAYYNTSPRLDPTGPAAGDDRPPYQVNTPTRVWRGCGWDGAAAWSRAAKRWSAGPDDCVNEAGFRVARTVQ